MWILYREKSRSNPDFNVMQYTKPFWIAGPWPGRLAISPRPRGGDWLDDETKAWRGAGVDAVVSLLEPAEANDLDLDREQESCGAQGIRFYSLPIADRSIPASEADFTWILGKIQAELSAANSVVIHCRQGVGRAGMVALALFVETGMTPAEAVRRVSAARGVTVPETDEQRVWIDSFAALLHTNR